MEIVLAIFTYVIYIVFWGRFFLHGIVWFSTLREYQLGQAKLPRYSFRVIIIGILDIILFRRLFVDSKFIWLGSWAFHVSFIFVAVRHLRYFTDPVPGLVSYIQPLGVAAGYVLPLSSIYLIIARAVAGKGKYVSYQNLFILGLVFAISAIGLVMRNFFLLDLTDVKEFALGILRFGPSAVPAGYLFIAHFTLFLLLIPYIPFHLFVAPCVLMEARRREEGLAMVMHEK